MVETLEHSKKRALELRHQSSQTNETVDEMCKIAWQIRHHELNLACSLSKDALELATRNDYSRGRGYALLTLGWCQLHLDKYSEARQSFEESRQLFVRLKDDVGIAQAINALGAILRMLGDHEKAIEHHQSALDLYSKLGDNSKLPILQMNIGIAYGNAAEFSMALENYFQAAALADNPPQAMTQAWIQNNMADILWRVEESEQAIIFTQQALAFFRQHQSRRDEAMALVNLGAAQQSRHDYQAALGNYFQGLEIARSFGYHETHSEVLNRIGAIYLEQGDLKKGIALSSSALEISRSIDHQFNESESLLNLGAAYNQQGDYKQAVYSLESSLAIAQRLNFKEVQYKTNLALSRTHENTGNHSAALAHFQAFHYLSQSIYGTQATRKIQKVLFGKQSKKQQRAFSRFQNGIRPNDEISAKQNASLPPRKLKQIFETINRHLEQKLALEDLAQIAGLNQHYFLRSFKQATGKTPHQYLIEQRVNRAKILLRTTALPLVEIAYQCGFSSQSHFSVTFRLFTELTPQQFRRSQ